ncbi:MAG: hypothetical protein Q4C34_04625 [Bacteroidales bacterium]|nr:hypothetical protein [Bacteroidales bacterium]
MGKLNPTKILRGIYRRINQRAQDAVFADYALIRGIPQHLDMINLGSTPARFALDYADSGVRGFNLAVCPQTLEYDYRMLKNYHSYLDDNGPRVAVLVVCPFSLLKDRYRADDGPLSLDRRYYLILHHAMINGYDEAVYQRLSRKAPLLLASKANLRTALRRPLQRKLAVAANTLTGEGMRASAEAYLAGWRREFGLDDLTTGTMSATAAAAVEANVALIGEMKRFCAERDITLTAVVPPLSQTLRTMIPAAFIEKNLYEPLRRTGLTVFDFADDRELAADDRFVDALCLNATGRRQFTRRLTHTLKQHNILR